MLIKINPLQKSQIKNKNYLAILNGYCGEIVLVGINYDKKQKSILAELKK